MLASLQAMLFDFDLLQTYGWRLLAGLWITLKVVSVSCVLGFGLAYPICRARMARSPVLSSAALAYVTFFRGTPLLCQLYLVYYGAGEIRPALTDLGLWWFFRDAYFCCIFAFTLNTAAYQSEIMRGALASVPRGQVEAAMALGMPKFATNRRVVWPQAALVAIRPMGNELITVIKASALAAIVTLLDLMGQTRFIFSRTFDFSVYLYCAVLYLMLTEAVRRVLGWVERRSSLHLRAANTAMTQTMPGTTRTPPVAASTRRPTPA